MRPKEFDSLTKLILSILITVGFLGVIAGIMISVKNDTHHDALNVMAGTLGTAFVNIIYSYFKKNKDDQ